MPEASPPNGAPHPARRVLRRPPISFALVGLVTLLTAVAGATVGALAWREKHTGSRALVDSAMAQAARMTADHTEEFSPIILQHRGTINEFIGDALLVLFGAPFERPDDAERAVRCAWVMQRTMAGFNAESQSQGLPPLVMGIAVHSGRVVAGNIGSLDRMKYGVVGPAVNLTGRIESLTVGPQVLISQATLDRVRHSVEVGLGTPVAVKGVPEPVTVYELRGVAGEAPIEATGGPEALAEVDLPAVALIVGEGKRVDETPHPVCVTRIGRGAVEFDTTAALAGTLADLKLAVDFGDGAAPGGSYVRVASREPSDRLEPSGARVRAVFTSLAETDRTRIDRLVDAEIAQTDAGGLSP